MLFMASLGGGVACQREIELASELIGREMVDLRQGMFPRNVALHRAIAQ